MSESPDNILGSDSDAELEVHKPKRKSAPPRTFLSSSDSSEGEQDLPPVQSQSPQGSSQNRELMIELGLSSDDENNDTAPTGINKTANSSSKYSSQLFNSLSDEDSVVDSPQYSDFDTADRETGAVARTSHNSTSQALFGEELSSSSSDNDASSNNESQSEPHGVKNRDLLGIGSTGDSEGVETGDEVSVRKQEILEEHVVDDHDDEFLDAVGEEDDGGTEQKDGADLFLSGAEDDLDFLESPPREKVNSVSAEMPRCALRMGPEMFYVKLPNFLSIDTRPFDRDYYEYEGDDEEIMDEEGRKRLKLKVENTIRWRRTKTEDGEEVRESNARIVKWKNGTMSLYLGNEIFDVSQLKMEDRCNHLYLMQNVGLQAQAIFTKKLNIKPCSTDSQTHRKITLSIAERVSRAQKLRILPAAGENPEVRRAVLQQQEDERAKADKIRLAKERARKRKLLLSGQKLSRRFLEDNEDFSDDGTSINAVKKKYQRAKKAASRKRRDSMDDFMVDSDEKDSWKGSASNDEEELTSSSEEEKEGSLDSDASLDIGTRKRRSSYGDDSSGVKRKKVLDDSGSGDDST